MQIGRRIAVAARRPALTLSLAAAFVLLLDQLSKTLVRVTMQPSESIPLLEDVLHLTYVRNTGAAFGLMPGRMSLFVGTSFIVIVCIAAYWFWMRPQARWLVAALGLVLGGAVGNLIDRASLGRVTDFIDFRFFPVFNIADSAIVVGVGMLMVWILLEPDAASQTSEGHADTLGDAVDRPEATDGARP